MVNEYIDDGYNAHGWLMYSEWLMNGEWLDMDG